MLSQIKTPLPWQESSSNIKVNLDKNSRDLSG